MPPLQNTHFPLALHWSAATPDDAVWHPSGQANVSAVTNATKKIRRNAANERRTEGLCIS